MISSVQCAPINHEKKRTSGQLDSACCVQTDEKTFELNLICFCSMRSSLNFLFCCEYIFRYSAYFIWCLNIFKLSWWYIYSWSFSKTFGQLMYILFETSFFGYQQCLNMHIAQSVVQTIMRQTIFVWKLIFVMECEIFFIKANAINSRPATGVTQPNGRNHKFSVTQSKHVLVLNLKAFWVGKLFHPMRQCEEEKLFERQLVQAKAII